MELTEDELNNMPARKSVWSTHGNKVTEVILKGPTGTRFGPNLLRLRNRCLYAPCFLKKREAKEYLRMQAFQRKMLGDETPEYVEWATWQS